jgi:hypothetical protein
VGSDWRREYSQGLRRVFKVTPRDLGNLKPGLSLDKSRSSSSMWRARFTRDFVEASLPIEF